MTVYKSEFQVPTLAELYPKLIREIVNNGSPIKARGLPARELEGVAIRLTETRKKFVFSPERDMNPVFPIVELMWYLSGSDSPEMVVAYASQMAKFVNPQTGRFDGAYGQRLRENFFGTDQITAVLHILQQDKDSRRAVMTTFDPRKDFCQLSLDIPCNVFFQFLIRHFAGKDRLNMFVYARSQDAWYGFPNDLIEWQLLQGVIAGWLGVEPGTLTHFVGSLHIYETELAKAKTLVGNRQTLDRLSRDLQTWKYLDMTAHKEDFEEIARQFSQLEYKSRTGTDFLLSKVPSDVFPFWREASLAVLAYNARKHKRERPELAQSLLRMMDQSSDLYFLLTEWFKRHDIKKKAVPRQYGNELAEEVP
jgi:thymidylate synthase